MKDGSFWFIMSDGCLWKVYSVSKSGKPYGNVWLVGYNRLEFVEVNNERSLFFK